MTGLTSMTQFKPEDDIKEDPAELERRKYHDEEKYNRLQSHFKVAIANLEEELLEKQTKLRDQIRKKEHSKRVQHLNTFYKK